MFSRYISISLQQYIYEYMANLNRLKAVLAEQDKTGKWLAEHNLQCEVYPAEWNKYERVAGPIRNNQMTEAADALTAFWGR